MAIIAAIISNVKAGFPVYEELISHCDLAFQLFEVQDAQGLTQRPRHADHSRETFDAALATAHRIANDTFAPHNRAADEAEPHVVDGEVVMVDGVQAAVRAYSEAGFVLATADESAGGRQLPVLAVQASLSIFRSANIATTSYFIHSTLVK